MNNLLLLILCFTDLEDFLNKNESKNNISDFWSHIGENFSFNWLIFLTVENRKDFARCNMNIYRDRIWPQMYINIVDIYQWMTSMMVKAFVHHRHAVCFHLGNSNRKFFVSGKCYSFRNVALDAFINFWGSRCTCLGSNEIKYEWKLYLVWKGGRPDVWYMRIKNIVQFQKKSH